MAAIPLSLWVPNVTALTTDAQEFTLPANARQIVIRNRDASIKLRWNYTGTDGVALSTYKEIAAATEVVFPAPHTGSRSRDLDATTRTIFINGASGTPSVELLAIP
jgi:hypothetical protein